MHKKIIYGERTQMKKEQKRFGNISLLSERSGENSAKVSCSLLIINKLQGRAVGKETSF